MTAHVTTNAFIAQQVSASGEECALVSGPSADSTSDKQPRMNPWMPDDDKRQARRIGKSLEELSELSNVLARISIQGMDAIDPASGKTNRARLHEETADVLAQIECNFKAFDMDVVALDERSRRKVQQMGDWESHFTGIAATVSIEQLDAVRAQAFREAIEAIKSTNSLEAAIANIEGLK